MNILVTGFEAFLENQANPTQEVVRLLPKSIKGHNLYGLELPVVYKESFDILKRELEKLQPEIVICLGLAADRSSITPERVAININDSIHPDNKGNILINQTIEDNGENAYFSTLPIYKIVDKLKQKNIKAKISNTAGLYVCNDIMYRLLHYVNQNNLQIKAGFIHVPLMDEQVEDKSKSLPLPTILEGVIDAIKMCL